jgi:pseudouridine-5'-phosphate glycosidase
MNTASLLIAPEVAAAQARGQAVVALESTIIAHGMPWPENLRTAQAVEQVVREHGAVPATIALLNGRICIGLTPEQLQQVAQDPGMMKASRRDLGFAVAMRRNAATTVSATMICAHLGGIEVFVTGGIGGVHREASTTFDISADLQELARTPVAVVCAGAKSILDLGLTLEYLETQGVPVISRGQANFAAFYTQDSGLAADQRIDHASDQARLIRAHWQLGLHSGVVLSNPIPDADAIARATMDGWIAQALTDARAQGISGKASTPFLLARIKELSGGASLKANQALVLHNARVGAELAVALAVALAAQR